MRPEAAREALRVLNGGAPADAGVPPRTLAEVIGTFKRWLHLPDERALLAVLGAVAANRLPGDPVWLVLVGPPGGGKSEILQATAGLADVHPTATLTEGALLSGTSKKERSAAAKGGLLRAIGEFGIVLHKDLGSILSMHHDARAAVLAALREVYDGSWTRHVGTDGGQTLHWEGKVGMVAGATPTIDRHSAVMGAMGERFLLFRLPSGESAEQAHRSLAHEGHEREMRAELTAAVRGLFERETPAPQVLTDAERERLVSLTTLVVRCRSAVERDGYRREIELIPESEAPTRLVKVLARMLAGMSVIGVEREAAWSVTTKAALDSIPALRRNALSALLKADHLTTSAVAEAIDYPRQTTERGLEDLAAHHVVSVFRHGSGKATEWALTDWTRERYDAATSSEKSGRVRNATSSESADRAQSFSINECEYTYDDFSDEVGREPPGLVEAERIRAKLGGGS